MSINKKWDNLLTSCASCAIFCVLLLCQGIADPLAIFLVQLPLVIVLWAFIAFLDIIHRSIIAAWIFWISFTVVTLGGSILLLVLIGAGMLVVASVRNAAIRTPPFWKREVMYTGSIGVSTIDSPAKSKGRKGTSNQTDVILEGAMMLEGYEDMLGLPRDQATLFFHPSAYASYRLAKSD